jgi:hypothetical protein
MIRHQRIRLQLGVKGLSSIESFPAEDDLGVFLS